MGSLRPNATISFAFVMNFKDKGFYSQKKGFCDFLSFLSVGHPSSGTAFCKSTLPRTSPQKYIRETSRRFLKESLTCRKVRVKECGLSNRNYSSWLIFSFPTYLIFYIFVITKSLFLKQGKSYYPPDTLSQKNNTPSHIH